MKILVTGAAGFIGKHTVKLLNDSGHDVIEFDKNFPQYGSRINLVRGDITNHAAMNPLQLAMDRKPDAVLHLAANSSLRKGIEDPIYDARQNIIGTLCLLYEMKRVGCKRIVFASTSAVYDPYAPSPFTEQTPTRPFTPYGISKLACEMYIRTMIDRHIILRYGNVYGPGQNPIGENILIARAINYMLNGVPFKINGDGMQQRDFVYVDDVAQANLCALKNPLNFVGALNVSTGRGKSVNQVIRKLKKIILYQGKTERGPGIEGETRVVIMKSNNIEKIFGWLPMVGFEKGLERTVEAWKKSESSIPVS